jgi:diacylglycerol kinase (ATP)
MSTGRKVTVVVNPAAGRGRGSRILPRVRAAFAAVGVTDVRCTAGPREERELARRALEDGAETLVAVGGDGTWSNVANAILHSGADCRLALLSGGTGCDFAKTTGSPAGDPEATARLVADGPDTRVDVGRIEDRYFLNVSGFGFDTAVLEDISRIRWIKGNALYMYSALRQLLGYRGVDIAIGTDAAQRPSTRHLMLIVANARNFGGSFRIAPDASLTDGMLDAVSIHDASALRRMQLFGAATKGTHALQPEVVTEKAAGFTLRFAEPPAYETDGEYNRASSSEVRIDCVPGALRIVTPGVPA